METFQQTPTTLLPLFPTPPIVPAQCTSVSHRHRIVVIIKVPTMDIVDITIVIVILSVTGISFGLVHMFAFRSS